MPCTLHVSEVSPYVLVLGASSLGLELGQTCPDRRGVLCLAPAQAVTAQGEGEEGMAPGVSLHL